VFLKKMLLSAVLLVPAMLIQVTVLARLNLPGAVPDLLLLVVIGLALALGPRAGSLAGFFGGLLMDLAPPADHAAGREALVLAVLGYATGLIRREAGQLRSVVGAILVVACAAVASVWLYAGVGYLLGDSGSGSVPIAQLTITSLIYDVLLAPFVVPAVMALARRFAEDPVAASLAGGEPAGPSAKKARRIPGLTMPGMRNSRSPLGSLGGRSPKGGGPRSIKGLKSVKGVGGDRG
jgi:rod shape-determining protein MreD